MFLVEKASISANGETGGDVCRAESLIPFINAVKEMLVAFLAGKRKKIPVTLSVHTSFAIDEVHKESSPPIINKLERFSIFLF